MTLLEIHYKCILYINPREIVYLRRIIQWWHELHVEVLLTKACCDHDRSLHAWWLLCVWPIASLVFKYYLIHWIISCLAGTSMASPRSHASIKTHTHTLTHWIHCYWNKISHSVDRQTIDQLWSHFSGIIIMITSWHMQEIQAQVLTIIMVSIIINGH